MTVYNLLRDDELLILADAIRAVVFQITERENILHLIFEGNEVFRIDCNKKCLYMIPSPAMGPELVWTKRWWRIRDYLCWKSFMESYKYHQGVVHRIKLQTYRQLFGSRMLEVIEELGNLMEMAEAEAEAVAKLDKTQGGTDLHPDIRRMIGKDENDV